MQPGSVPGPASSAPHDSPDCHSECAPECAPEYAPKGTPGGVREGVPDRAQNSGSPPSSVGGAAASWARLFQGSGDLLARADRTGRLLEVGGGWTDLLGWPEETLVGRSLLDLVDPADRAAAADMLARAADAPRRDGPDLRFRTAAGDCRWLRWTAEPLPDGTGFCALGRDATDRRLAQDALQARERFEGLTQQLWQRAPVFLMALQRDGRVLMANDTMLAALGYGLGEVLGQNYLQTFVPEGDREAFAPILDRALQSRDRALFEHAILTHDGHRRHVEWHGAAACREGSGFDYLFAIGIDITERQQSRQEQARLTAILEATTDFVGTADASGRVTYINQAGRRTIGLSACDSLDDLTIFDLVSPRGQAIVAEEMLPALEETDLWTGENELCHRNGQTIDVSQVAIAHRDETGRLAFTSTIVRDISAQKQAREALRESEERFRTLVGNVPGTIYRCLCDDSWTMAFISEAIADLSGYPAREFLFNRVRSYASLIHPDDRDRVAAEVLQAIDRRTRFSLEYRIRRADGATRWVYEQGQGIFADDNRLLWIDGAIVDISDRVEAERRAEEQYRTLRAVIDNAPLWIWTADPNGHMTVVNRTFCENLGVQEAQLLAVGHYQELLGEEACRSCVQSDRECYAQEGPHFSEELFPFTDGNLHHLEVIKVKFRNAAGEVAGLIGLAVDATKRKQAEEALRQSKARLQEQVDREQLLNYLSQQIRQSIDTPARDTIELALHEIRNLLQARCAHFAWYEPEAIEPEAIENETGDGTGDVAGDGSEAGTVPDLGRGGSWAIAAASRAADLPPLPERYGAADLGSVGDCLKALETVRIDETEREPDAAFRALARRLGWRAWLAVPLAVPPDRLGVLVCDRGASPEEARGAGDGGWRDPEVALVQAVANQLAIATTQADLFARTQSAAALAEAKAAELEQTLSELRRTQAQLVQTEKMSSLGQLVAGVAHEINNPVNFIYGNLAHADDYARDLLDLLAQYRDTYPEPTPELADAIEAVDLEFLAEDLPRLLASMKVGADRIMAIVKSLRNFSRSDEAEVKVVDLHDGLDSTLTILHNRLKAKADRPEIRIVKDYGPLPPVECYPGPLNQVFMNVLANAIDALEERDGGRFSAGEAARTDADPAACPSEIRIATECRPAAPGAKVPGDRAIVRIADNGPGIPAAVRQRLFDPFFTTKPVGKGTGLGLSISYQIVTEKHGGSLACRRRPEGGTEFEIVLPVSQAARFASGGPSRSPEPDAGPDGAD